MHVRSNGCQPIAGRPQALQFPDQLGPMHRRTAMTVRESETPFPLPNAIIIIPIGRGTGM